MIFSKESLEKLEEDRLRNSLQRESIIKLQYTFKRQLRNPDRLSIDKFKSKHLDYIKNLAIDGYNRKAYRSSKDFMESEEYKWLTNCETLKDFLESEREKRRKFKARQEEGKIKRGKTKIRK